MWSWFTCFNRPDLLRQLKTFKNRTEPGSGLNLNQDQAWTRFRTWSKMKQGQDQVSVVQVTSYRLKQIQVSRIGSGLDYRVIHSQFKLVCGSRITGWFGYSDTKTRKVTRPRALSRSSLLRRFEPSTLHSTVCSTFRSSFDSNSCTATRGWT